ncbi:MAG: hypothetical protein RJB22_106 [Pseudomonadota bacterium]
MLWLSRGATQQLVVKGSDACGAMGGLAGPVDIGDGLRFPAYLASLNVMGSFGSESNKNRTRCGDFGGKNGFSGYARNDRW